MSILTEIQRIGDSKKDIVKTIDTIGAKGYLPPDSTSYIVPGFYSVVKSENESIDNISRLVKNRVFVDNGYTQIYNVCQDIGYYIYKTIVYFYKVNDVNAVNRFGRGVICAAIAGTGKNYAAGFLSGSSLGGNNVLGEFLWKNVLTNIYHFGYSSFDDLLEEMKDSNKYNAYDDAILLMLVCWMMWGETYSTYTSGDPIAKSSIKTSLGTLIPKSLKFKSMSVDSVFSGFIDSILVNYFSTDFCKEEVYKMYDELLTYITTLYYTVAPDTATQTILDNEIALDQLVISMKTVITTSRDWGVNVILDGGTTATTFNASTNFYDYIKKVFVGNNDIVEVSGYTPITGRGYEISLMKHMNSIMSFSQDVFSVDSSSTHANLTASMYALACTANNKYVYPAASLYTNGRNLVAYIQNIINNASGGQSSLQEKLTIMCGTTTNRGNGLEAMSFNNFTNTITWDDVQSGDSSTTMNNTTNSNFNDVSTLLQNLDSSLDTDKTTYRSVASSFNTYLGTSWNTSGSIATYAGVIDGSVSASLSDLISQLESI